MKFSLSSFFDFLNIFKKKQTKPTNQKWINWARETAVSEVTKNVEETYKFANIFEELKDTSPAAMEEIYLGTSLNMTSSESFTLKEIKDMFELSLGEQAGIMVSQPMADKLANHYFTNYYSDESQKQFYKIRHSKEK